MRTFLSFIFAGMLDSRHVHVPAIAVNRNPNKHLQWTTHNLYIDTSEHECARFFLLLHVFHSQPQCLTITSDFGMTQKPLLNEWGKNAKYHIKYSILSLLMMMIHAIWIGFYSIECRWIVCCCCCYCNEYWNCTSFRLKRWKEWGAAFMNGNANQFNVRCALKADTFNIECEYEQSNTALLRCTWRCWIDA